MLIDAIKFRGHRCFKTEWAGFDALQQINVIIGRNNTGKSQLLDLVEAMCDGTLGKKKWELSLSGSFQATQLRAKFPENYSGGSLGGAHSHWHEHGAQLCGTRATWQAIHGLSNVNSVEYQGMAESPYGHNSTKERMKILASLLEKPVIPFQGYSFIRLYADRDIRVESADNRVGLQPDGAGATNIIRRYRNSSNEAYPLEVIQEELRASLNAIFSSDGHFEEILVQEHDEETPHFPQGTWEVYLVERRKGRIPLSKSGSGLKTVILVLLNLLVMPKLAKTSPSRMVFAFEELENNLHPALLRRLLKYIAAFAREQNCHVFLTTHSSAALDIFGPAKDAQIIHVHHDGECARTETVKAHFERLEVVSQLGAKPSDLLQANGIIWVEGPSDRVYINQWIKLYADGKYLEGRDYQCALYGGALLARLQATDPEAAHNDLVNLVTVNPNFALVCDSDRSQVDSELKKRVQRLKEEVEKSKTGHVWVTACKEIENYTPGEVFSKALDIQSPVPPDPGKHERLFSMESKEANKESYLEAHLKRKTIDKVELASQCVQHMTLDQMKLRFDWDEQMGALVAQIEKWNR